MGQSLVRGRWVICKITGPDSAAVVHDGAVLQTDGLITEVGTYVDLRGRYPDAVVIGSGEHVVMPGLVNDHFHVGLTPFQLGTSDNNQEIRAVRRLAARQVDPYLDQLYGAIQMVETGTTTVQTMFYGIAGFTPEESLAATDLVLNAYQDIGMRVSYAPMVADQNSLVVGPRGDERAFAATLPGELARRFARNIESGYRPVSDWVDCVEQVIGRYGGGQHRRVRVTLAPSNVHRCTDALLLAMQDLSNRHETAMHVHVQESPYQKLYGVKYWEKTPMKHLDDLGLLGPRTVCSHSTWATDEDIELLAATGTTVCYNPSSNLRIHNGIAPIQRMVQRGIRVALGTDEATINDDKDMFAEMRLALRLQYLPGLENVSPTAHQVFQMATEHGAYAASMGDLVGTIEIGKRADLILLGLANITTPYLDSETSEVEAVVYRGRGLDVDTVMIDGDVVMENRELTHVDKAAVFHELNRSLDRQFSASELKMRAFVKDLEPFVRRFLEDTFPRDQIPHYMYNSRH